ncbi:MAG: type II toxin-antitoxin system RelE/ParE family toxin [Elusimicrobia bacterium]|nr:type II toxin-antitoxin system RelE/ParE family toxin [Elusimicrobiota bacterium]
MKRVVAHVRDTPAAMGSLVGHMDKSQSLEESHVVLNIAKVATRQAGKFVDGAYADLVRGKIRELRPRQARVLYFFTVGERIVFVHGIVKKRDTLDPGAIDVAEARMAEWLRRHGGGEK